MQTIKQARGGQSLVQAQWRAKWTRSSAFKQTTCRPAAAARGFPTWTRDYSASKFAVRELTQVAGDY
jgi:hypothetical protein